MFEFKLTLYKYICVPSKISLVISTNTSENVEYVLLTDDKTNKNKLCVFHIMEEQKEVTSSKLSTMMKCVFWVSVLFFEEVNNMLG